MTTIDATMANCAARFADVAGSPWEDYALLR